MMLYECDDQKVRSMGTEPRWLLWRDLPIEQDDSDLEAECGLMRIPRHPFPANRLTLERA